MKAKKWLTERYFDEESGDWFKYNFYEAMEEYHQSELERIIPTNKEIFEKFPQISTTDKEEQERNVRNMLQGFGAKWLKSEIEKRNKQC